jgi:type II secretory pathway component PulF
MKKVAPLNSAAILTKPLKSDWQNVFKVNISLKSGASIMQKAIFAKNLAVMLRAGLTISEALDISIDSSAGNLKKTLTGVAESVRSGNSLAESFGRYPNFFSNLFVNATYAGEISGTLDRNFEAISIQLEKEKELVYKIQQALLYPAVVLVAAFALGMGLSYFILPKIIPLFEGMRVALPLSTRILISISYFVRDHGLALLIGIVAGLAILSWLFRQRFTQPFTHWIFLKTPVASRIIKNSNLSRFCRNLNTLLQSGLSIDRALDITKDTIGNYYYRRALEKITIRVIKGGNLSDDLRQYNTLFPAMLIKMIMVGEKSGQLEETLSYLADYYEAEVDNATKTLSVAIEPILLLIIGLVVAFLALSIITPIYNITGSLHG